MADVDVLEESSSDFRQCYGMIDYHIKNVLARLRDEPIKDVSEDVMVLCSTEELREARDKLYTMAKKKVHEDAYGGDTTIPIMPGKKSITDPWGLIARRSKKRLDEDVCKLYLFVVSDGYKIPYKILKRGTMKENGNQRDIRSVLRSVPREPFLHDIPRDGDSDGQTSLLGSTCDPQIIELVEDILVSSSLRELSQDLIANTEHTPELSNVASAGQATFTDVSDAECSGELSDTVSPDDSVVSSGDDSQATDDESFANPLPVESEGASSVHGHVLVVPVVIVTPPLSDIGVQCSLIDAPALQLLPKKGSPGQKIRYIIEEMARNHEESWDDLIEAEQIVNPPDSEEDEEPHQPLQNAVQDQVGRDEFEGHVEFQDRALSEHESRIGALEMATQQFDHRVDVVDAVLQEKMRLLRIRQEDADGEMLKVRHFIKTFLEQASMHNSNHRLQRAANNEVSEAAGHAMTGDRGDTTNARQLEMPTPLEQRGPRPARRNPRHGMTGNQAAPRKEQPKLTPGVVYSTPKPSGSAVPSTLLHDNHPTGKPDGKQPQKGKQGNKDSRAHTFMDLTTEPPASSSRAVGDRDAPADSARCGNENMGARPKSTNQGNVDFSS